MAATAKASPVTPAVLAWALEEDGRDYPTLAEALEVDLDLLDAWAAGDASPTHGQVSSLAKVLRRPRPLFFMPRPPVGATLPPSFRHPPGDERLVGANARRQVRRARRIQQAMTWALRDEPPVEVPHSTLDTDADEAARQARTWLGISMNEQASWRDQYRALREWRHALEERGILVFSLDIGRDDVRGFSAWDERAPLIVTNSTGVNPAARCYTLMHELGHLMLRQDAACIEINAAGDVSADVERWCERFGAAVLMPASAFRDWADGQVGQREVSLGDVNSAMKHFSVSARAAALRFIYLGYATPAFYTAVSNYFAPKPRQDRDAKISSPPRSELRQRQYGDRVLRLVLDQLPVHDALSMLRMEVGGVRRLADRVPGIRDI